MQYYLKIIDITKKSFHKFNVKINFKFFKMHTLTHYIEHIKKIENLDFLLFAIDETTHIDNLKKSFNRINKRFEYEMQLFRNNIR